MKTTTWKVGKTYVWFT